MYTPHDLRHTRVVLNELAGIPRKLTMMQTGHQSQTTHDYYNTASKVDQKRIIEMQEQAKVEREKQLLQEFDDFKESVAKVRDEQKVFSTDDEFDDFIKSLWDTMKK